MPPLVIVYSYVLLIITIKPGPGLYFIHIYALIDELLGVEERAATLDLLNLAGSPLNWASNKLALDL